MKGRIVPHALLRSFLIVAVASGLSTAGQATGLDGVWLRDDGNARVRIGPCGDKICATNLWIGDTTKGEAIGDKLVMSLTRESPGRFSGTAYDAKRGMTYAITVKVGDDALETRGCVLYGVLCKAVGWRLAP